MPNVSDFLLDHITGKAYFDFDDGSTQMVDLSKQEGVQISTYLNRFSTGREALEYAINENAILNKPVLIDTEVTVDVTGGKEIYLPVSGCKVVFLESGKINALWDTNPLFVALHSNFTFVNTDIEYKGPGLDANINYSASPGQDPGFAVQNRMKTKMQTLFGNTFSGGGNALWYGPHPLMSGFCLMGETVANFKGSTKVYVSQDVTADNFIPWVIAGKGQWKKNVTGITTSTSTVTPNANVIQPKCFIDNLYLDGTYMGIQGEFDTLDVARTRSYRYSDLQNPDGSMIGGSPSGNSTPPPHLFYVNERNNHINIMDTIDYGIWVTNNVDPKARRDTAVGSCCSLKVGAQRGLISGYISYRPDGLADLLGDQSGFGQSAYTLENFYSEYDSSVCGNVFPSIRWPSPPYIGTTVRNGKLVDTASQTIVSVLGGSTNAGNKRITIQDVEIEMQDFGGTGWPGTYFNGEKHSLDLRYKFKAHTQTQTFRGLVAAQGVAGTGMSQVKHRCEVIGWRNFTSDVNGLKNRVLIDGGTSINNNMNTAELIDVSNGHTVTQVSGVKRERWTQKIIQTATAGGAITTSVSIPANWSVIEVVAGPKVALGATSGCTGFTFGWSGTPAGLGTVTGTSTSARYSSTATIASNASARTVTITPTGGNFDGTGTIEIVFTCELLSLGE